jgi:hypothetical protein
VRNLSAQAGQAAAHAPDRLAELSAAIKAALREETDPYVTLGVLLEGAVQILVTRIPPERHRGTIAAAVTLLRERLADGGKVPVKRHTCTQTPH